MKYVVEYTLATATIGLMILTVADEIAAENFVSDMASRYGHSNVSSPTPLVVATSEWMSHVASTGELVRQIICLFQPGNG